jgi:hypothetical protein
MSLLWRTAVRRTAAWEPRNSVEHIHPSEMENDYHTPLQREHVSRMADSIKQHGYSPERHGQLGLNVTDEGENIYHHTSGTDTHPDDAHPHEHLLKALQETGHGDVPVHVHDQSSTEEHPAPEYYHGTTVEDLERIHPNHGNSGNFGQGTHARGYAYATGKNSAWNYAEKAADNQEGVPHVYKVSPRGPVEEDPHWENGNNRGNNLDDVRSKHGFDTQGEEEMPQHLQNYYHDRIHGEEGEDHGYGEDEGGDW